MRKLLALLLISVIFSIEDWIYIVGVSGNKGVIAKLYLKIINGSGNVYVDTFPLTQIDTQASARIARNVACEILNINCSKYDFLYRIEGESPIVGGPSAGAAMTVLALALLSNKTIRKDVIITGTISPDWSIGPVGGIPQKYLAAKNFSTIFLIPYGQKTEELKRIESGTKIIEVKDILEAFYYFAGERIVLKRKEVNMDRLKEILKEASEEICKKAEFYSYLGKCKSDYLEKGKKLMKKGCYYSSASYCVRALKECYEKYISSSEDILFSEIDKINKTIEELKKKEIFYGKGELELVFIFYDRLYSAERYFREGIEEKNIEKIAIAKSKLESAKVWLSLIKGRENKFDMKKYRDVAKEILERAKINCLYAFTFSENQISLEAREELENAEKYFEEGNYIETIFSAKRAEALAELSLEFLNPEKAYEKYHYISKRRIEIEVGKGFYPILALSYLEYGETLKNDDINLAVYFLKLATKFSSLPSEIYEAKSKHFVKFERPFWERRESIFLLPGFFGAICLLVFLISRSRSRI